MDALTGLIMAGIYKIFSFIGSFFVGSFLDKHLTGDYWWWLGPVLVLVLALIGRLAFGESILEEKSSGNSSWKNPFLR